jgi:transcriptional regulator with XRE-family HTH domain
MSTTTIENVKVNLPKFKALRGNQSLAEFAEKNGLKPDMYSKIERGDRWTTLNKFAEFCVKTNTEPNDFFEIVKKIS